MPRPPRVTEPGLAYHLLNRRVMRLSIFQKASDFEAFERVLAESLSRCDAPHLLAYCLMPNHWHLVVLAREGTNLSRWVQWVTVTHTHRWHAHHGSAGEGPLYQGRFKSFPVAQDAHFLAVCRYVEANPVRAGLVDRAEQWRWSSLWVRQRPAAALHGRLADWPVERPRNWPATVNRVMPDAHLERVRRSTARGVPLGEEGWRERTAERLGLNLTLRPRGRPPNKKRASG